MKKKVLMLTCIVLTLILSIVSYSFIWGGKPYIENFSEVSAEYEVVAHLALSTYEELMPEEEYIIISIHNGNFEIDNSDLILTEEQQKALLTASDNFDYLRVCKDAVFFCENETGKYGLVYSEHPLRALYNAELPQKGREYHRINSHWYEWGTFGI